MDSITQAVLGMSVGYAVLGHKLGRRALVMGGLVGTLPDLDIVLAPFLDTAGMLVHHRGASHSLLVTILASLALAPLLARWWKKDGITNKQAAWFVFWVWLTHILIDVFTLYGTSVLWPFSDYRAGFNNFFIIDGFFTGPLVVTIAIMLCLRTPENHRRRLRLCWWGLGISSLYVCLSLGAKWHATASFHADLEAGGVKATRTTNAPTPFNILLWRAVAEIDDELWVGYYSILDPEQEPVRWTVYPRGRAAYQRFADKREIQVIDWFSEGYWIAREHGDGLAIGDLRFMEDLNWSATPDTVVTRPGFAWLFDPDAPDNRLRSPSKRERVSEGGLGRLYARIFGERKAFTAAPYLQFSPEVTPEPLRVVE